MFFSVSRSRDGKRLSYGMSPFLRGALLFALASVLAMLAFSLTAADVAEAPLAGKVNLVLMPTLLALGSLYRYRVLFDAGKGEAYLDHGLVFAYHRRRWTFDEVTGLIVRSYPTRKLDPAGTRYVFGFYFSGKPVILEKGCAPGTFQHFYYSFKSFFPRPVNDESDGTIPKPGTERTR